MSFQPDRDDGWTTIDFDAWVSQFTPATRAAIRRNAEDGEPNAAAPTRAEPAAGGGRDAPDLARAMAKLAEAVDRLGRPAVHAPAAEALSKEDAAVFLGVGVATVEHLIRTRKVRYVQLGSQRGRVIPVEALRKLLQKNAVPTGEEESTRRSARR